MGTGELGPTDMIGSEDSGTHLKKMLCDFSLVRCKVARVCKYCRPAFRMILPLISELQVVLGFNFEHRKPVINHKFTNATFCCKSFI